MLILLLHLLLFILILLTFTFIKSLLEPKQLEILLPLLLLLCVLSLLLGATDGEVPRILIDSPSPSPPSPPTIFSLFTQSCELKTGDNSGKISVALLSSSSP